jgi:hypothetical protein
MEPITLLHALEIERRLSPAHRHLAEARQARAAARRARVRDLVRAAVPSRRTISAPAGQPCGC